MTGRGELIPPRAPARGRVLLWLERALFALAVACLGSYTYVNLHARAAQQEAARQFEASLAQRGVTALPGDAGDRAAASPPGAPPASAPLQLGDVVGRLEVPRLGISVMVLEGDDDGILGQAAGHIPSTALPARSDQNARNDQKARKLLKAAASTNVGIAGHRDTFFRPLKDVRKGDEIRLTTDSGSYLYTVESFQVVSPDRIDVLAPADRPLLTLVTCYPFYYVGHAPSRFIVRAALAGSAGGGAAKAR
ncbi:MAG TPA: class D sortase [Thermoanaerobaculia bacterium]